MSRNDESRPEMVIVFGAVALCGVGFGLMLSAAFRFFFGV